MATTASGSVSRNTEPQEKCWSRKPAHRGPSALIAAPSPDHSAIAFVRLGPDQSAVISASVVGYAMPADRPPPTRASPRTVSLGANAASSENGIASAVPPTAIRLRP